VTLRELLAGTSVLDAATDLEIPVSGLCDDSRRARPGDLFFGLTGLKQDGQAFVRSALTAGAVAAVVGPDIHLPGTPLVRVDDPRQALAQAAAHFFGHPSRSLAVVGVTGTNGKTTTTWMLESILRAAGRSAGVIGTTGTRFAGETRAAAFTTPGAIELEGLLREMVDRGVQAVAMEISSHALAQRRAWGVECDVAVFTNLTQDHLDYHHTMESYLDAKLMLFDGRNGPTAKPTTAVVNADDPAAPQVIEAAERGGMKVMAYGAEFEGQPLQRDASPLAVNVQGVKVHPDGLALQVVFDPRPGSHGLFGIRALEPEFYVRLRLLGRYNAWNAAAAMTAAFALGIDRETVIRGLEIMPPVPGRLERVGDFEGFGNLFKVVVDYAHTPDALERALDAAREHASGRVLLVFGCGGDRDRAKRPIMGRIAAAKSDRAWVTNDNPRSEDPEAIAAEIVAGATAGTALEVELDRYRAIAAAIRDAEPGDLVLIAGKGHETTQTIGDQVLPFDDREVAREILGTRGAGA
jgi:UDP-N-acetylmuramoyl-L-alanyl-D-glutamate--2,6-diaminopimelate ligase